MRKINDKIFLFALTLIFMLTLQLPVHADENNIKTEGTALARPEDLYLLRENPTGIFYLERDINMKDVEWVPFAFSGTLEGNGFSLLNLSVSEVGAERMETYDGNYKVYDTCFAGLFSKIEDASISNLNLVNVHVDVEIEDNCFIGAFAGFAENSTIQNCNVTGELSLTVNAPMFGVGGIVGFGYGKITETDADVTLICIDTNAKERDEQFLGGVCGAGYVDVEHCNIDIDGYISEHGYVHSGGLIGMYFFYPLGTEYYGAINHNHVAGKITFFEDNTNRRAYCKGMIGEILIYEFDYIGNSEDFLRDERYEYDKILLPEMCENPEYEVIVTEAAPENFGFSTYTCKDCGYSYTDDYLIYQDPNEIVEETEEIIEDTGVTESVEPTEEVAVQENEERKGSYFVYVLIAILLVGGTGLLIINRRKQ